MGAWGYGPFDNDSALDFVGDLADGDPGDTLDTLSCAMGAIADDGTEIDRPAADDALAAAVLIAGRLGARIDDDSAAALLASHPFEVDGDLRQLALNTIDRLSSPKDNEWYELWDDAGAIAEVLEALRPYRSALSPAD